MKEEALLSQARDIAPLWGERILAWYRIYGRHSLPWRNLSGEHAPYGVYVSEIMLQQTQVRRVLESYYAPFMAAFPSLAHLARAPEEAVLRLWQGLGYYTRARNLHKSAKLCLTRHGGALPSQRDALLELPGIGTYSAGAILCFGFLQQVSFVDGNITRLLSRCFALKAPTQRQLWNLAEILLSRKQSFDYNQGLLDVGAMICTPKAPQCAACPLESLCLGKPTPLLYPTPKSRPLTPLELQLLLVFDEGAGRELGERARLWLVREEGRLYHGLYNLPSINALPKDSKLLGSFKHHYTKYAITASLYHAADVDASKLRGLVGRERRLESVPLHKLPSLPLSSLCQKALKLGGVL